MNNTGAKRGKNELLGIISSKGAGTSKFENASIVESFAISENSSSVGDKNTLLGSKRKSCSGREDQRGDDEPPSDEEKARKMRRVLSKDRRSARKKRDHDERLLLSKLSAKMASMTAKNQELKQTQKEMKLTVQNLRRELKKTLELALL